MKVVFKVMSEDTLKRQRQEDEEEEKEPLTNIHWVSIVMSGGAVTMLVLAILLYLLFKWRVMRCFNNRETELTQVTTTPLAPQQQEPISDLEMSMTLTND